LLFLFSQSWHGNTLLLSVLPGVRPLGVMENITAKLTCRYGAPAE